MKKFLKKNATLVLAFSLPVLLIVGIAVSTYLPSLFLSTDYNFVYISCSDGQYYYRCPSDFLKRYEVVDNALVVKDVDPKQDSDKDEVADIDEAYKVRFFLHDTALNEGREITLEEVQSLKLNGLLTSPDGVTVSFHYNRGTDFLLIFDGGSSYGHYLTKGKSKRKLNLIHVHNDYYYNRNFQFIGWVLPGRN